jgi:formylglycine-generating enzyme required for sulfatase activity
LAWYPAFGAVRFLHSSVQIVGVAALLLLAGCVTRPPYHGPGAGQTYLVPPTGIELVPIPAGTFTMGTPSGGNYTERPVMEVALTEPFWLGKTPVTQAQFQSLMGYNPSNFRNPDNPVEQVSWNEAMEFCRRLTASEQARGDLPDGYAYTLPTEAQWEYACRSGTTTPFYTGATEADLARAGWYAGNSDGHTHPVGLKQPNTLGLYDMLGNVWQWCRDWFWPYTGGKLSDPSGDSFGALRSLRGGSWFSSAASCTAGRRDSNAPDFRYFNLGFRVGLCPVPPPPDSN